MKRETVADVAGFIGNVLVGSLSVMVLKNVANPVTILDKVVTVGGGFLVSEIIGEKVDDYCQKQVNDIYEAVDIMKGATKKDHIEVTEEK